jgi:hypothetical protein
MAHADYPHWPGTLFDCFECQEGGCVCDSDAVGCASMTCRFDSIPVDVPMGYELEWEENGHA